jgi:hypothetical protein
MDCSANRTARARGWCGLLAAGALAVVWQVFAVPEAAAQQDLRVLFARTAKEEPAALDRLPLRPNTRQGFYLYVQNTGNAAQTVTVQLRANGRPVEGATATVEVPALGRQLIAFPPGKPEPKPAPPPAGSPPPPPPPGLDGPPFTFQVVLLNAAGKPVVTRDVTAYIMPPNQYIEVVRENTTFTTTETGNRLTVELRALADFTGPACPVELVLRTDRIPGLLRPPRRDATYRRLLTAPNQTVQLTVENLPFAGNPRANGLVYVTVDGYERAFILETTFDLDRRQVFPERVTAEILNLDARRYAPPDSDYPVRLEVDNTETDIAVELGLDRDKDGRFAPDEVLLRRGHREQHVWLRPLSTGGSLEFNTAVRDWEIKPDTLGLYGERELRARLFDSAGGIIRVRTLQGDKNLEAVYARVTFDGTPPENVKFGSFPPKLLRGAPLTLTATGRDPESQIREVAFFLGKPTPDRKPPPNAELVPATAEGEEPVWTAKLPAPTDQKGTFDVSVQFVNNAGLHTIETVRIELVDPPPGGANTGSIAGTVLEGTIPQPDLEVTLWDAQRTLKGTTRTNAKGEFLFENVPPGAYTVYAVKASSQTRGTANVNVEGGKKASATVRLAR